VPPEKVRVLYSLYLDFALFQPAPSEKQYDVLFVGRLAPNKGLFLLLDALARVKRERGGLRAAIAGQGPLRGALEARARSVGLDGSVEWLGWLGSAESVAALYRRSRCLVCASYSEGGPRVVAEALACGTPVISTPVGMAGELVRDGHNGYLVTWSVEALANRLLDLLADEDLQRALSGAAPEAVQGFQKVAVVRAYAEAYRGLAGGRQDD
jgi:glycosyltransferase involved in cell wall biosynthesis